jgi:hypothetical protein
VENHKMITFAAELMKLSHFAPQAVDFLLKAEP